MTRVSRTSNIDIKGPASSQQVNNYYNQLIKNVILEILLLSIHGAVYSLHPFTKTVSIVKEETASVYM